MSYNQGLEAHTYNSSNQAYTVSGSKQNSSLNSSKVNATDMKRFLNNRIDVINQKISDLEDLQKYSIELTEVWKGGGNSKNAGIVQTINGLQICYKYACLGLAYEMQLISEVKSACNTVFKSYSDGTEDLFE